MPIRVVRRESLEQPPIDSLLERRRDNDETRPPSMYAHASDSENEAEARQSVTDTYSVEQRQSATETRSRSSSTHSRASSVREHRQRPQTSATVTFGSVQVNKLLISLYLQCCPPTIVQTRGKLQETSTTHATRQAAHFRRMATDERCV